ncbi:MAG: serine/threonine dehydratase [Psychrosphaera sp.]|nr:serine/threonine dehydratase [Psychrosphaera sp.]
MSVLTIDDIHFAAKRITGHIHHTPLIRSTELEKRLGHRFYFKLENQQKTGSFKVRGAYNTLAWLKELGQLPTRVVTFSSGNHAQAIAWAAAQFSIDATVLMAKSASAIKIQATQSYGANVVFCESGDEIESRTTSLVREGFYLIPPDAHKQVICGQGTVVLEALLQQPIIDAIFVPCGGGGLLSGSLIAARGLDSKIKVFGTEPMRSNAAAQSMKCGKSVQLSNIPDSIADGVNTVSVSEVSFQYIKQCDGIVEQDEQSIIYWTQWLTHLLKMTVEPAAALAMAGAVSWLKGQDEPKDIMILISGGNLDCCTQGKVWVDNFLNIEPGITPIEL